MRTPNVIATLKEKVGVARTQYVKREKESDKKIGERERGKEVH